MQNKYASKNEIQDLKNEIKILKEEIRKLKNDLYEVFFNEEELQKENKTL